MSANEQSGSSQHQRPWLNAAILAVLVEEALYDPDAAVTIGRRYARDATPDRFRF